MAVIIKFKLGSNKKDEVTVLKIRLEGCQENLKVTVIVDLSYAVIIKKIVMILTMVYILKIVLVNKLIYRSTFLRNLVRMLDFLMKKIILLVYLDQNSNV